MKSKILERDKKIADGLLVIQAIVTVLLLAISPIVMVFTPWIKPYELNELTARFCITPKDEIRYLMIILGLFLGGVSVVCPFIEMAFYKQTYARLVAESSMGFCGFSLGWIYFPFWVTGAFQAYLGEAPLMLYDPLHIPPGSWLGPFWYFPVLLIYFCTVILPFIFIFVIYQLFREKSFLSVMVAIYFFIITFLLFLLEPNLIVWLMD